MPGPDRSPSELAPLPRPSRRRRLLVIVGGALVVVALLAVVIVVTTRSSRAGQPPAALGHEIAPPWPAPRDVPAAVRAAGLTLLGTEGTAEHLHTHLDVRVDGRPVEVPALIGLDEAPGGGVSPLHTHDASGVIHVESPVTRDFTLGEFFSEWDVSLTADNLGALHAGHGEALHAYVNGTERPGNPADIVLAERDELALIYGPPPAPDSVPARYAFPVEE